MIEHAPQRWSIAIRDRTWIYKLPLYVYILILCEVDVCLSYIILMDETWCLAYWLKLLSCAWTNWFDLKLRRTEGKILSYIVVFIKKMLIKYKLNETPDHSTMSKTLILYAILCWTRGKIWSYFTVCDLVTESKF